jgi:hypothetical protein
VSLDRTERTELSGHDSGVKIPVDKGVWPEQLEQDNWDRTAWTGQPGQDSRDRTAGTGQPGQDSRDRTAETGQPRTNGMGQLGQKPGKTAGTTARKDILGRTARTGKPREESRDRKPEKTDRIYTARI